ncbi:DedA family protein [Pajaroellobacter abortibovis]|uniref:VTT domain-containing protein n=1 Tax=Pajaroellobacter abortibovis TaxID=1882918 RepID=A0A1L6MX84_9BACT|nr:DedA family protein [Pajaroellobacter abortibovis]APS00045.1 hypothetical protein BCY86_04635 [Pajaroellobacter abortibovis]
MVKSIFAVLSAFCLYTMGALGYLGVVILMGIESACVPLPSELIMPYAGALSHPDVRAELSNQFHINLPLFNLILAGLVGAIGCNLGSEVAYWVGASGGRRAIEKYGRYVLIDKHEIALSERWFRRWGEVIILVARLLPIIRTFIAFPAGVVKMNRFKFHLYTFLGSVPWCVGLAWCGQELGIHLLDERSFLRRMLHKFDLVIVVICIALAGWFVRSRLRALRSYQS